MSLVPKKEVDRLLADKTERQGIVVELFRNPPGANAIPFPAPKTIYMTHDFFKVMRLGLHKS
ncbi:MAG: hypothetical protein ACR2MX_17165 [Cyclobacteriaceae bacterium]